MFGCKKDNSYTVSWQTQYDHREPRCTQDEIKDRIRELIWDLNIDSDVNYTLEELEEMQQAQNEE